CLVAVHCRRVRNRQHRTCRALEGVSPRAVLEGLLEHVVDPVAELRVVLGEADAVWLLREGVADDLELAATRVGKAGEDDVVRGQRDRGARTQGLKAVGVAAES